jgi:hypothetical protein
MNITCKSCQQTAQMYFKCIRCNGSFCECSKKYIDELVCATGNCYYCRTNRKQHCYCCTYNHCFGNTMTHIFCEKCVPDVVKIKQERIQQETHEHLVKLHKGRETRRQHLIKALKKAGLELRPDSKLCKHYIEKDNNSLDYVVQRMCEMKYLFEYRDMRTKLGQVAARYDDMYDLGVYPSRSVFEQAEYEIICKEAYPKYWPWQAERAARIIQRGCYHWLSKPITNDGKLGIFVRLGLRDINTITPIYPHELV